MPKKFHSKLIIIGSILLICLPIFAAVAGLFAFLLPRQYYAHTTIEYKGSNPPIFSKVLKEVPQSYRKEIVISKVRNTDLYQIGVYDSDPQQAAIRANKITLDFQNQVLGEKWSATVPQNTNATTQAQVPMPSVNIWEKAETPAYPTRPHVGFILFLGMGPGLLLALVGLILLVIGFIMRASSAQNPPAIVT